MRFVLLVEGETEQAVVGPFLKRWLDPQLRQRVGIQAVGFAGWPQLLQEIPDNVQRYSEESDTIAVVGLVDFYGPMFPYPPDVHTATERRNWAASQVEEQVGSPSFRMFFAVHEVEAWLFSQPSIFPIAIRPDLPKVVPEAVNSRHPPSTVLETLYRKHLNRHYNKRTDGIRLFRSLDPVIAREKCPALKELQDELLTLAKAAGL